MKDISAIATPGELKKIYFNPSNGIENGEMFGKNKNIAEHDLRLKVDGGMNIRRFRTEENQLYSNREHEED